MPPTSADAPAPPRPPPAAAAGDADNGLPASSGHRFTVRRPLDDRSETNAGNSRVAGCRSHDFGQLRSSDQHADGINQRVRYDFLLVFYSDVRSSWNRCQVSSPLIRNNRKKRKNNSNATKLHGAGFALLTESCHVSTGQQSAAAAAVISCK